MGRRGRPEKLERNAIIRGLIVDGARPTDVAKHFSISRQRVEQIARPQKPQARAAVRDAIARGEIIRPEACSNCHAEGPVQAHHDNYWKPLDVRWLCSRCHGVQHRSQYRKLNDALGMFRGFIKVVANG